MKLLDELRRIRDEGPLTVRELRANRGKYNPIPRLIREGWVKYVGDGRYDLTEEGREIEGK